MVDILNTKTETCVTLLRLIVTTIVYCLPTSKHKQTTVKQCRPAML